MKESKVKKCKRALENKKKMLKKRKADENTGARCFPSEKPTRRKRGIKENLGRFALAKTQNEDLHGEMSHFVSALLFILFLFFALQNVRNEDSRPKGLAVKKASMKIIVIIELRQLVTTDNCTPSTPSCWRKKGVEIR